MVSKLELATGLKFHAEDENDNVWHGGVYIRHLQGNHLIKVILYDKTEGRFTRADPIPSVIEVNDALESTIDANPSLFTRLRNLLTP